MADKKPGRGGHGAPKKKGKKAPKAQDASPVLRKSNKREKTVARHRFFEGNMVTPAKYFGASAGYGNYMAGMVNGALVRDGGGKPIPFRDFLLEAKKPADF